MFVRVFATRLSKALNPTECLVFWSLYNASRSVYKGVFPNIKTVLDCVPCRLSVPQLRRVINALVQKGLVTYSAQNGIRIKVNLKPEDDVSGAEDGDQNDHDRDQNDHHDQNDHVIKMITSHDQNDHVDDQNDHPHFINKKIRSRKECVCDTRPKTTSQNPSHSTIPAPSKDGQPTVPSDLPPSPEPALHLQTATETATATGAGTGTATGTGTGPQPTIEQIANHFLKLRPQTQFEVATIEASKFLNYYASKGRDLSSRQVWQGLAENWLLRDLDRNFQRNSAQSAEQAPGAYIDQLSLAEKMRFFKSLGF